MKFLIVAVLLFLQSAFADDSCSDQNLITEANSPFQQLPVYDQDGNGICYAYTAAQLVNYHLIKNGEKKSVHPLWAALKYSEYKNKKEISSGNSFGTIQELINSGNCNEAFVTNAFKDWATKTRASEAEIFHLIEKFASSIQNMRDKKKSVVLTMEEVNDAIKLALNAQKPYCMKGQDFRDIVPELQELGAYTSARAMFISILTKGCKNQVTPLKIPEPIYTPVLQDDLSELRTKLNNLRSPVSITYCSESLYDPKYDGIVSRGPGKPKTEKNCGEHESIIAGKKMVNGQCHYLLRNTWGPGFHSSTNNWKCLCRNKKDGTYKDDCKDSIFNIGKYTVEGCWISEETLSKNTIAITSLGSP